MIWAKRWVRNVARQRADLEQRLEEEQQRFTNLLDRAQKHADNGNLEIVDKILTSAENIYWKDTTREIRLLKIPLAKAVNKFYDFLEGKQREYRNHYDPQQIKRIRFKALRTRFINNLAQYPIEYNNQGLQQEILDFEKQAIEQLASRDFNWQTFKADFNYNEEDMPHSCYKARQAYLWNKVEDNIRKGNIDANEWQNTYASLAKLNELLGEEKSQLRNIKIRFCDAHQKAYHTLIDRLIDMIRGRVKTKYQPAELIQTAEAINADLTKKLERPAYRTDDIERLKLAS